MSDIVERLRQNAVGNYARIPWPHRLLHDAAAEIERLRAALQSIADITDYGTETTTSRMTNVIHNANVIARAALGGDA